METSERDLEIIRRCIGKAEALAERGAHPFAAALALNGEIILEGENSVIATHDPTAHGEMNLLRRAFAELDSAQIAASTLYSSLEPCAMCSGAIYWAGISRVVYGCSANRLAELAGKRLVISCRDIFAHGTREIEVAGPLLEDEAEIVHRSFWKPGQVKGPGLYGTM